MDQSEEIFNQIADELRSQVTTIPQAEKIEEETITNEKSVNDQITDSVTQVTPASETTQDNSGEEIAWYEQSTKKQENISEKVESESPKTETVLDEDLQLLMEYKKSGKTLADFVKEYQVEDFSTWADEKIVEEGLKNFMKLEQDEIEQALYDYKNSSVFQKKQLVESFREKFEQKNQEKLKQLKGSNADIEAKTQAIAAKYQNDLNEYAQKIEGKEMFGLKITDEMSANLKHYIDKEFSIQKADGSFDIEKVYSIALWLNYGADLVKANITRAKNEGREQVIKEVTNPSKNMSSSGKLVSSGLEAVQEAFNTLFPG